MEITLHQQIEAVRRELQMRRRVYRRWVETGKLIQSEADYQIAAMEAVLETLKKLDQGELQL